MTIPMQYKGFSSLPLGTAPPHIRQMSCYCCHRAVQSPFEARREADLVQTSYQGYLDLCLLMQVEEPPHCCQPGR